MYPFLVPDGKWDRGNVRAGAPPPQRENAPPPPAATRPEPDEGGEWERAGPKRGGAQQHADKPAGK